VINEVKIKNFKSVADATLSLGRFNILIGSNGSGKSNILEAIAFGGAASADKLDNEFLGSRGIRTSEARLMKSAFSQNSFTNPIQLDFKIDEEEFHFTLEEEERPILKWFLKERNEIEESLVKSYFSKFFNEIERLKKIESTDEEWKKRIEQLHKEVKELSEEEIETAIVALNSKNFYGRVPLKNELSDFNIYSPEISSLRKIDDESQIKPLGIKGEGLFDVLQIFNENYGEETINELKKYLHLIEWFDDFEAVNDKTTGRKSLVVKDRYIKDIRLNQSNINEGFLFLLFYISLFISKETPTFFAIDNIEASFHPRLCEKLIKDLVVLSKTHNKQIILTTHNPFVLDGLDLNDTEQRLFVVRRNADGETIADPILTPPKNVKLSEAWNRGYIGAQPDTIE